MKNHYSSRLELAPIIAPATPMMLKMTTAMPTCQARKANCMQSPPSRQRENAPTNIQAKLNPATQYQMTARMMTSGGNKSAAMSAKIDSDAAMIKYAMPVAQRYVGSAGGFTPSQRAIPQIWQVPSPLVN